MMRRKTALVMTIMMVAVSILAGCGKTEQAQTPKEINVAYQYSLGYAPFIVMKDLNLVEKAYGDDITVNWVQMNNGSEISEALVSGDLDVGAMGVPVAVTGIQAGSPYKIAFGMSSQPYAIVTSNENINSLSDISDSDQIAIVNINSMQHVILAMAAKAELGDAHALDSRLTVLNNADGYEAMISGVVSCHMVISPYNFLEVNNSEVEMHEIDAISNVWDKNNTAIVGVIAEEMKNDEPEVYDAFIEAYNEATAFIEENPTDTAKYLAEGYDASEEDIEAWITDERSNYDSTLHGVMNMVDFMLEEGFLEEGPESIDELVYEGVEGD
ncbi:MAG: ABC transporter substrate-binding protein [Lachnospiraceae bacterium]|nr:ABC transporter substrate-binding protein [Lachnospiraceae bacterium]